VRAETGVVELVGPAGVVEEPGGDERHVDVAGLLDRLAVVQALGDGELAAALLHETGDAEQVLAAVCAGEAGPGALVRAAGGRDGRVHVVRVGGRDAGDRLLGGRGDRVERRAVPVHESAVDEQAVLGAEVQDRGRLGSRRVVKEAHACFFSRGTVSRR